MDSIEFTISKNSKQHLADLQKLQEFIGNKSIFVNNTNKVLIDIPTDKLKLSTKLIFTFSLTLRISPDCKYILCDLLILKLIYKLELSIIKFSTFNPVRKPNSLEI